jgi:hypothetical protein
MNNNNNGQMTYPQQPMMQQGYPQQPMMQGQPMMQQGYPQQQMMQGQPMQQQGYPQQPTMQQGYQQQQFQQQQQQNVYANMAINQSPRGDRFGNNVNANGMVNSNQNSIPPLGGSKDINAVTNRYGTTPNTNNTVVDTQKAEEKRRARIPMENSEIEPLILPGYVMQRVDSGDYYKYEVKQGENIEKLRMDRKNRYDDVLHSDILINSSKNDTPKVDFTKTAIIANASEIENVVMMKTIDAAVDTLVFDVIEKNNLLVKRTNANDKYSSQYLNTILTAKDTRALVNDLTKQIGHTIKSAEDKVTTNALQRVNDKLTEKYNEILTMCAPVSSSVKSIPSLVDCYEDLTAVINKLQSEANRAHMNATLQDFIAELKDDVNTFNKEYESSVDMDLDLYKSNKLIPMLVPFKHTCCYTNDTAIVYELSNLKTNELRAVREMYTPRLYSLLGEIIDKKKNMNLRLFTDSDSYLVRKSKYGYYTIKKA